MGLNLIPWWVKALVLAGVALMAWAAWSHYTESLREEGRAEVRAQWSEAVRIAQRAEDERAAERRRLEKEAEDATAQALARLATDVTGARAAADRLQRRSDELVAAARRKACPGGAAAGPAPGQQGADPAGMLADMRRRIDEAAGRIGDYADRLHIAGTGCERRHDALTSTQLSPQPLSAGGASPSAP